MEVGAIVNHSGAINLESHNDRLIDFNWNKEAFSIF